MIKQSVHSYVFPRIEQVMALANRQVMVDAPPPLTPDDIEREKRRGYETGRAEGLRSAELEVRAMLETARRQGWDAGHGEGLTEAERAVSSLREALTLLGQEQKAAARQVEEFAVELALAVVARIVEADSARSEFVRRLVNQAVSTLAPARALCVRLNPADRELLGSKLDDMKIEDDLTVAPGHAKVEAGDMFVEGNIDQAFAELSATAREVLARKLTHRAE